MRLLGCEVTLYCLSRLTTKDDRYQLPVFSGWLLGHISMAVRLAVTAVMGVAGFVIII